MFSYQDNQLLIISVLVVYPFHLVPLNLLLQMAPLLIVVLNTLLKALQKCASD